MLSRRKITGALCGLLAPFDWTSGALAQSQPRYPGAAWDEVPLSQSGWSAQRLDIARDYSHAKGSAAVVVVQHGAVVASWGDTATNLLLNSARKSLLSALMGIAVGNGQVHLDDTLARLGIDDIPPALTEAEKQATVRDLLEARSGVYHDANYETPSMRLLRPARGSHPHGTYWYYNNWDFNALGAIYEHATGTRSSPHSHSESPHRSACRISTRRNAGIPAAPTRGIPPICSTPRPAIWRGSACLCCAWGDGRIGRSFPPTGCRRVRGLIP